MPSATQQTNMALVDLLQAYYSRRIEPNFVWGNVLSMYRMLPMLRAFWPVSSVDENGAVYDASAQGRTLTNGNSTGFGIKGLFQYANFVRASSNYLYRNTEAGLAITGALTMGGWFRIETPSAGVSTGLMGRYGNGIANQSYLLYKSAADVATFLVGDGVTNPTVGATITASNTQWYFISGRYTPSTRINIFINGVWYSNPTAIPAALIAGGAQFKVGAYSSPAANFLDGQAALLYLCATDLPDRFVESLFHHSKYLFSESW